MAVEAFDPSWEWRSAVDRADAEMEARAARTARPAARTRDARLLLLELLEIRHHYDDEEEP